MEPAYETPLKGGGPKWRATLSDQVRCGLFAFHRPFVAGRRVKEDLTGLGPDAPATLYQGVGLGNRHFSLQSQEQGWLVAVGKLEGRETRRRTR